MGGKEPWTIQGLSPHQPQSLPPHRELLLPGRDQIPLAGNFFFRSLYNSENIHMCVQTHMCVLRASMHLWPLPPSF
jgi:hypothetical protein